jgi:hypothetical protein
MCLSAMRGVGVLTRISDNRTLKVKRRAVTKASLTRMQTYISGTDLKINELKVRFEALPSIFNKFDAEQEMLEI